jgi:hypothetical protein
MVFANPSLLGFPAAVMFNELVLLIVSCLRLVISVPLIYTLDLGRVPAGNHL